jgi:hypothetical protein
MNLRGILLACGLLTLGLAACSDPTAPTLPAAEPSSARITAPQDSGTPVLDGAPGTAAATTSTTTEVACSTYDGIGGMGSGNAVCIPPSP